MATTLPVPPALDSLGMCHLKLLIDEQPLLAWLRAATDGDTDEAESLRSGQRIQTLRHALNAREAVTVSQAALGARERGDPPLSEGPLADIHSTPSQWPAATLAIGIDRMTGLPLEEAVAELELPATGDPALPPL